MLELAESIKQYGVLQPLLVQERRIIMRLSPGSAGGEPQNSRNQRNSCDYQETYQTGNYGDFLIENIQREDLNPIEEALAFKRLLTEFNLKQDEVAERVSRAEQRSQMPCGC